MKLASGSTGSVATDGPTGSAGGTPGGSSALCKPHSKRNWNRWTAEEHALLQQLVQQLGASRSWSAIAAHIPGRTGKQCRERWINHQDEDAKTGSWSAQEEWLYSTELKAGRRKEDAYKFALLRWELHVPGQQIMEIVGFWPSKQWPELLLKLPPEELMPKRDSTLPLRMSPRGLNGPSLKPGMQFGAEGVNALGGHAMGLTATEQAGLYLDHQAAGVAAGGGQAEHGGSDTSSQVHGGDVPQQLQQQHGNYVVQRLGAERAEQGTPGTQHVMGRGGTGVVKLEQMQGVQMQQEHHVYVDKHGNHHMGVSVGQDQHTHQQQGWGGFQYTTDQPGTVVYGLAPDGRVLMGPTAPHSEVVQMVGPGGMQVIQQSQQPQQWIMPMVQQQQPAVLMMGLDGQMVQVVQQAPSMPSLMMMGPNGQLIPVQTAPASQQVQMVHQVQQMAPVNLSSGDGWTVQHSGGGNGGGMQLQTRGSSSGVAPQQQGGGGHQEGSMNVQMLPNGQMVMVQAAPNNGVENHQNVTYMTVGQLGQGNVTQPVQLGMHTTSVTMPSHSAQPVYHVLSPQPAASPMAASASVPAAAPTTPVGHRQASGGALDGSNAHTPIQQKHQSMQQVRPLSGGGDGRLVMVVSSDDSTATPLRDHNLNTAGSSVHQPHQSQPQLQVQHVTGLTTTPAPGSAARTPTAGGAAGGGGGGGQLVLDRAAQQALLKQLLAKEGIDAVMAE